MNKMIRLLPFILLPLFCNCSFAHQDGTTGTGPFEYKEIYLPEGIGEGAAKLGLNSVDEDWGIWGHNLSVVVPKNHSMTIYASVNGSRNREQFCFSSDQLFGYIENYIEDNFGENHTHRFAILPNDNSLVCQCEQCVSVGNTATDSSPAAFKMLERLAKRFPKHIFFSLYYLSTKSLPKEPLPENTGVLVSAMDYPLTVHETAQEVAFTALLKSWSQKVSRVYVWDYINNFDDYFTPYPVLNLLQRRFQIYEGANVKGIFLNGSGTAYSSFSKLKTYIIRDLMENTHQDLKELVMKYCHEFYPVTGNEIASYLFLVEATFNKRGKSLPLYEGVPRLMDVYLDPFEFSPFHMRMLELLPQTVGEEKEEITTLCKALAMTRLEIKRVNRHIHADTEPLLELLEQMPDDGIHGYSETYWSVKDYVEEYREMISHDKQFGARNLLKDKKLEALTPLDEDYNDISILTDGQLGLPSNYHCGQMLSSADPSLRIRIPDVSGMRRIRVSFTVNKFFHIGLPLSVTLTAGDSQVKTVTPVPSVKNPRRSTVEFIIPAGAGPLVLTIVRDKNERTMAIDEIEGL